MMVTGKEFKRAIIENMGLALVQFKTEWSGACQIISPVYEELANAYRGVVRFFIIDIEKDSGMDKEFGVTELPTILFFKNGVVVDHVVGLVPKNVIISKIENGLSERLN